MAAASTLVSLPYILRTQEGITVTLKRGSITDEKVDVIVNSTGPDLNLKKGPLSNAILTAAGQGIQDECKNIAPNGIKRGDPVVVTSGGNLPAINAIYHGSISNWKSGKGEPDLLSYIRCFLDKAHTDGKQSLSIPAITTGRLSFPHKVVAKMFYQEICKFSSAVGTTTLQDIRIVVFDDKTTKQFQEYFTEVDRSGGAVVRTFTPRPDLDEGITVSEDLDAGATAGYQAGQLPTDQLDSSTLFAYRTHGGISVHVKEGTLEKEQCDAIVFPAKTDLQMNQGALGNAILRTAGKTVQQECLQKAPNGAGFGEVVKTSAGNLGCKSIYHIPIKKYTARGPGETAMRNCMSRALEAAHNDNYQTISFPSVGTGVILGYPPELVSRLMLDEIGEFNIREPATSVTRINIAVFEKDHSTKEAFKKAVTEATHIVARMNALYVDTPAITLPQTWTQMRDDEEFLLINVPSDHQEYKDVAQAFHATVPSKTIFEIERVQSKRIYQMYALQKAQMEGNVDKNKFKVERTLYHGTPYESMDAIIRQGFNRSYSGMNAASYGNGTYFAVAASYSASRRYSPEDNQGRHHIFQCRALTGEYTKGQTGMKTAPAKSSADPHNLFHSVVNNVNNPTVFVIFTDFQAYPEYTITFK